MKKKTMIIMSPLSGKSIPLSEVSDQMFSEEMLGKGCAVIPTEGTLISPMNGVIDSIPESCHAVMMTTDEKTELLIHIGIDTVELKGQYFFSHVSPGDKVRAGDVLIKFDLDAIKAAGYDVTTPIVVTNSDNYKKIKILKSSVASGEGLIELSEK